MCPWQFFEKKKNCLVINARMRLLPFSTLRVATETLSLSSNFFLPAADGLPLASLRHRHLGTDQDQKQKQAPETDDCDSTVLEVCRGDPPTFAVPRPLLPPCFPWLTALLVLGAPVLLAPAAACHALCCAHLG